MSNHQITAIVPIKRDSKRLERKNFKNFNGRELFTVVLDKLQALDEINQIIVNTDADEIKDVCAQRYSKVVVLERPDFLRGNHITMNSLIAHDVTHCNSEHFLQTHVTNPLLSSETIRNAIHDYFSQLNTYDSLFSVNSLKKRIYDEQLNPINHENGALKMTQDLPEILVENSNLFLFSRTAFLKTGSRIGERPYAFRMRELEGLDIDFEDDLLLAELIERNNGLFNLQN